MLEIVLYSLWGLCVGFFVGASSIGVGLIGVPGLLLFFKTDPSDAVASMGFAGLFMMFSSLLKHKKNSNIHFPVGIALCVTSLPAAYLAAHYATVIGSHIPLKNIIVSIIFTSILLLGYRYFILKSSVESFTFTPRKAIFAPLLGIVLGTIIGLTSISGSLIMVSLLCFLKLPMRLAIGTTSLVAFCSLFITILSYVQQGRVVWGVALSLLPGAFLGAWIGATVTHKIPIFYVRCFILTLLSVSGILVIFKA